MRDPAETGQQPGQSGHARPEPEQGREEAVGEGTGTTWACSAAEHPGHPRRSGHRTPEQARSRCSTQPAGMGKEGGRRVMGEEESEIAAPPPSSLLARPPASSSGGGAGAARVAGMQVRGLGEPPEPPVGTTRGQ